MKYHDYFGHETDLLIAEIGHYESEQFTKDIFQSILKGVMPHNQIFISNVNTNPIKYL